VRSGTCDRLCDAALLTSSRHARVSIPFIPAPAPGTPYYPIEVIAEKMPALSYQVSAAFAPSGRFIADLSAAVARSTSTSRPPLRTSTTTCGLGAHACAAQPSLTAVAAHRPSQRERFLDVLYQTPENLMKAGLGQPGGQSPPAADPTRLPRLTFELAIIRLQEGCPGLRAC